MLKFQVKNLTQRIFPQNRSIARNLVATLFLIIFSVTLVSLAAILFLSFSNAKKELEAKADEYITTVSNILSVPLWNFDENTVKAIGNTFSYNEFVATLEIHDMYGPLFFVNKHQPRVKVFRQSDIFYNGVVVGKVSLSLSSYFYYQHQRQILNLFIPTIAIVIITLVLSTSILLRLFFLMPLKTFVDSVHSYEPGNRDFFNKPVRYQEFRILMNVMVELDSKISAQIDELRKAKKDAVSANESKSEFLANISHELRTPLFGILSYSDFGITRLDNIGKNKIRHYFSQIKKSGNRLLNLVNELLDLSKLEAGKMEFKLTKGHLFDAVSSISYELAPLLLQKNIFLKTEKPLFSTEMVFDFEKILQLLRNLLVNAIKFSPEGRVISIVIEDCPLPVESKPGFKVSVIDQGVGIPEDEREYIFEKFSQSTFTDTKSGGTGLGLAISKYIVENHGGYITTMPNPEGEGSIFMFHLPKSQK